MTRKKRLRVLIADDDPGVRNALAELIRGEPTFQLVGAAIDATEAAVLAAAEQPDVVLLDVRMRGGGGQAAARSIRSCSPASKLIAFSEYFDRSSVREMLQAGVVGYVVKGGPIDEIIEAVKRAAQGQGSLSSVVTSDIIDALAGELRSRYRTSERRRVSKSQIRRVIRDDTAFAMVFQPIVELRSRAVVGAEALARFTGQPVRGPNVWFAEATKLGLGVELELAAVAKALAALHELPDEVYLTVNVSPTTLASTGFHALVAKARGGQLVAEITEHALVEDYDRVVGAVGKLRALGMRLAVDDAGAGFASFRHILNLKPELIKLDLTLIRSIDRDCSRQALAASLISFADNYGATIIAEGIEHTRELEKLGELGVGYGQGYLLGRPAPLPLARISARRPLAASPLH